MATTKVYAPNGAYNGQVAGVAFVDGVGTLDEKLTPAARRYFERHGYGFGQRPDSPVAATATRAMRENAPTKSANKGEWEAFARKHGATDDDLNGLSKDAIIERFGYEGGATTASMDSRDFGTPTVVGTPLRDAAVDPQPGDFLAPVGAGTADPHGPAVVSPEIHASGPAGIRPGDVHVDDTDRQEQEESALAESVLIEQEEHPAQPAPDPETGEMPDVDRGPLGLSDPGSADRGRMDAAPAKTSSKASWESYAVSRGMDPAAAKAASRASLIEQFGPTD